MKVMIVVQADGKVLQQFSDDAGKVVFTAAYDSTEVTFVIDQLQKCAAISEATPGAGPKGH